MERRYSAQHRVKGAAPGMGELVVCSCVCRKQELLVCEPRNLGQGRELQFDSNRPNPFCLCVHVCTTHPSAALQLCFRSSFLTHAVLVSSAHLLPVGFLANTSSFLRLFRANPVGTQQLLSYYCCRSEMEGGSSYADAPTSPTLSVTPVISWTTPWSRHPARHQQSDEATPSRRQQRQLPPPSRQDSLQREREQHLRGQHRQTSLELLGACMHVVGRRDALKLLMYRA